MVLPSDEAYPKWVANFAGPVAQVAAATVLTIVPTIILFFFVQNRLVAGLTAGAVKGE